MDKKTRWPDVDLKLVAFSENIWRRGRGEPDPEHVPPPIDKMGNIIGDTNPRIVPETETEMAIGLMRNLWRNLKPKDIHNPPKLSIDENGHIIGLPETTKIYPETKAERDFLKRKG